MLKLSIIIPVYNVEKYVGRCIESCLDQDMPKDQYEIIVVNDGTKDNSVAVVEKYITPENNVTLIHRENGGLSAARNTGLQHAKGEYVWFVDSDDWIERDSVSVLLEYSERNNLDVLCFNRYKYFDNGEKSSLMIKYPKDRICCGSEFISIKGISPGAWCAIYNRSFLQDNGLYFMEGVLHEDQEFTPRAFYLANRICFYDYCAYYYYQREGSIMRSSQSEKRCGDILKVADSLYRFSLEKCSESDTDAIEFSRKVSFLTLQAIAYYSHSFFPIEDFRKLPFYPLYFDRQMGLKLCLKTMIFNLSPSLYLRIYKFKI